MIIPAIAVDIIPDISIGVKWEIASESKNVVCAAVIVKVISASSTFLIFSKNFEKIYHINKPKNIPHNTIDKNANQPWNSEDHIEKCSPCAIVSKIPSIIKNTANDVPSLNKLSHSKIKDNLLGAHTDLNKASTATGSVAEIIAQNNNVTIKGIWNQIISKIRYNHHQIINVEIKSHTTANENIVLPFFNNSL